MEGVLGKGKGALRCTLPKLKILYILEMKMIDVKDAVSKAKEYVTTLEPATDRVGIRLEEVEKSDNGNFWLVTLNVPIEFGGYIKQRLKIFKIDAATGEVLAMNVREE